MKTQIKKVKSIGVDMAKRKFDVCFTDGKNVLYKGTFENNESGIEKYKEQLIEFHVSKKTPMVVESTGDCQVLFCLELKKNWTVYLINPLITKAYLNSKIRKQKSDSVDAKILAEIGIRENLIQFETQKETIAKKKKLGLIRSLEKKIQGMTLSLKSFEELYKILGEDTGEAVRSIKASIEELKKRLKKLEDEIEDKSELCQKISKIEGVSKKSASKVLLCIADKEFETKQRLCGYAGIDVSTKTSGDSIHTKGKISKRGNSYLRKVLFQIAWGLMMHNEKFKKLYEYHKVQGKHYFTCLIIIARKFLNILFGMMKSGKDFDPEMIIVPT